MQQSLYQNSSTAGSESCHGSDQENPYKAVGSHVLDSSISQESVDEKERVLQEAAEACKNDPEIKKEIDKANRE